MNLVQYQYNEFINLHIEFNTYGYWFTPRGRVRMGDVYI